MSPFPHFSWVLTPGRKMFKPPVVVAMVPDWRWWSTAPHSLYQQGESVCWDFKDIFLHEPEQNKFSGMCFPLQKENLAPHH
jgi:hypothetical protein